MATHIGRYEILAELGRGGMAMVYHARDPRFKREVAIKVLPREFLHDPHFRARFDREAEIIAALEHPAIVPVHDFGEEDGQPYLVMRYMPGGSLADRLGEGPFSLEATLHVLGQIAPALDYAHARKVIHRDLKPGNILFDADGHAYLSDFGIAKLMEATSALTGSGVLVGTPLYMSPEQIDGKMELDARSDLYSLGVIVFQMLAGEPPFKADTPPRILVAHLTDPVPSILALRPDLPPGVEDVIQHALAKDRADRLPSARALAEALERAAAGERIAGPEPQPKSRVATALDAPPKDITGLSFEEALSVERPATTRREPQATPRATMRERPAPARKRAPTWVWIGGGLIGLVVCVMAVALSLLALPGSLDQGKTSGDSDQATGEPTETSLAGTPAGTPSAAPQATLNQGEQPALRPTPTVAASMTPTEILLPTPLGGESGRIAFASDRDGNWEIYVMDIDGSNITRLTDNSEVDKGPAWSPDGTRIAFVSERGGDWNIYVMDSDGANVTRLTDDPASDQSPAWSPDGTRVAFTSSRDGDYDIYVMDSDGANVTKLTDDPASDQLPAWTPDGTRIAFVSGRDGNLEIYVMDADGSNVTRLTDDPAGDLAPAWSPDGTRVAFTSSRDGDYDIYVMDADGSNPTRLTNDPAVDMWWPTWSPDGMWIAFTSSRDGDYDIYVMDADGLNITRLTDDPASDDLPAWQP